MSGGTFNTPGLSPYTFDHGRAAFYAAQDQERRERELAERANHWLALRLSTRTFDSYEALRAACLELVVAEYGEVDDERASAVNKAITSLWLGRVEWALFREPRVTAQVTDEPHTVTFANVA